ncbi:MAG: hypothetical protein WC890_07980 [Candidatus Margulisiibacteriota bacterium]
MAARIIIYSGMAGRGRSVSLGGISELEFDPGVTEAVLARAERASADLLTAGRYASIHRMHYGP